jgi:hypothetical protein
MGAEKLPLKPSSLATGKSALLSEVSTSVQDKTSAIAGICDSTCPKSKMSLPHVDVIIFASFLLDLLIELKI